MSVEAEARPDTSDAPVEQPSAARTAGPVPQPETGKAEQKAKAPEVEEVEHPKGERRLEATAVPLHTLRAMYGISEMTANGGVHIGDVSVVQKYEHGRVARPSRYRKHDVARRVRTYVQIGSESRMAELLRSRSVVCLSGVAKSGRTTTACFALAQRHGPDQIHEIHLPPGVEANVLAGETELLVPGEGHILRLTTGEPERLARLLEGVARSRKATLVLIHEARAHEEFAALVKHQRVSPEAAFASHLCHWLDHGCDGPAGECKDGYVRSLLDDGEVRSTLGSCYRMSDVTELARKLAENRPTPGNLKEFLTDSAAARHRRAEKILLVREEGEPLRHHRGQQYERAFRIAYAAFHGDALGYVFDAAGLLLDALDEASGGPQMGRSALEHSVPALLGEALAADWTGPPDARTDSPVHSRTVWLREPALVRAIFDVAWHDLDNTRPAMLTWLRGMAERSEPAMWKSAAAVAGILAHFDFQIVHDALIDKWANDRRQTVRQVAAHAAAIAVIGGQVTSAMLKQVHRWGTLGYVLYRDTAARFFVSGVERVRPGVLGPLEWVLSDLRLATTDRLQCGAQTIGAAVAAVYRPTEARPILDTLATWSRAGHNLVQLHAARAFVRLADWAAGPQPEVPELLERAAGSDVELADLVRLWTVALLHPDTARRAWELLDQWILAADVVPETVPTAALPLRKLAAREMVRRRLNFYLPRFWHGRSPGRPPRWAVNAIGGIRDARQYR